MNLVEDNELELKIKASSKYEKYYNIMRNEHLLGYCAISTKGSDMLYLHILDLYQGNEIGTYIFKHIISMFKESGINKICMKVLKEDLLIQRIISHYKNVEKHSGKYINYEIIL